MKKRNIIAVIVIVLLLTTISMQILNNNKTKKTILTSTQNLSTKKIGWGIKRNDNHEQPDLGKTNKKI